MAKKKHTPEEIINKLREAEVVIAAGSTVAVAAPVAGVSSDPSLMTDYSLREDAADPTRPFGPWFYRIVVNDAIKATQRRDRTTTLDRAEDTGGRDESTDPEAAAVLNEERKAVHEALERLTPAQRGVVVMRYFLDLSEAEMVERTGRMPGTVKRHLHDARARMRQLLQGIVRGE